MGDQAWLRLAGSLAELEEAERAAAVATALAATQHRARRVRSTGGIKCLNAQAEIMPPVVESADTLLAVLDGHCSEDLGEPVRHKLVP